jgi:RimJ/RimL family protein N-acetyltransferase
LSARDEELELVPLETHHAVDLHKAAADYSLFKWFLAPPRADLDGMHNWVAEAVLQREKGISIPFTLIDVKSGAVAGSTRYMNIDDRNNHVEIGGTWLSPAFQRTRLNTRTKLVLLGVAFDTWKVHRVEFKTDLRNEQSQAALRRLGAVEEGVFRERTLRHTDTEYVLRSDIYFSILRREWPAVQQRLLAKLARPTS